MAKTIKARFWVNSFDKRVGYGVATLQAVNRKTEDNVDWAHFSPSGKLELTVGDVEGGAFQTFDESVGKDVLLTMEIVEPE